MCTENKTFTALDCTVIHLSLSSSCFLFPIESTSFLKTAYHFTVKDFFHFNFNKWCQQLAGVLGVTEITEQTL